jgi:pyruvate kinase
VTDVANAILDGTDAVMLSQETAVGAHPVGVIATMAAIAERAEKIAPHDRWLEFRVRRDRRDAAYTLAYTACRAAKDLKLAALVCPTQSGRSARLLSAHRPEVPILALSPGLETVRRCSLMWGVQAAALPQLGTNLGTTDSLIAASIDRIRALGWVNPGQRVGVMAGAPQGRPGMTSLFLVQDI